jgi:hypothetical protein
MPSEKAPRDSRTKQEQDDRRLSEVELDQVSGGAAPINDKPRKAEPVSGATTKADPINS